MLADHGHIALPLCLSEEIEDLISLSDCWDGSAAMLLRTAPCPSARKTIKPLRGLLQFLEQLGQLITDTRNFPQLPADSGIARGFGHFETALSFTSVVCRTTLVHGAEVQRLECSRYRRSLLDGHVAFEDVHRNCRSTPLCARIWPPQARVARLAPFELSDEMTHGAL
jgi:hypothetical protein